MARVAVAAIGHRAIRSEKRRALSCREAVVAVAVAMAAAAVPPKRETRRGESRARVAARFVLFGACPGLDFDRR